MPNGPKSCKQQEDRDIPGGCMRSRGSRRKRGRGIGTWEQTTITAMRRDDANGGDELISVYVVNLGILPARINGTVLFNSHVFPKWDFLLPSLAAAVMLMVSSWENTFWMVVVWHMSYAFTNKPLAKNSLAMRVNTPPSNIARPEKSEIPR